MVIVPQSTSILSTSPQVLLLPAPPKRLALPAPRIKGYLPAPKTAGEHIGSPLHSRNSVSIALVKRVVEVEIVNPLHLIDMDDDFDTWWAAFERIAGRVKTIDEMNAELEAKRPGIIDYLKRGVA